MDVKILYKIKNGVDMRKSKVMIGSAVQNKKENPGTTGINVKIIRAFERPEYEIEAGVSVLGCVGVLFAFDYKNQKQIDAMNQEYGDGAKKSGYTFERIYNDMGYYAVSDNGLKIDYIGVSIFVDAMLDAVMKRFIEQNKMTIRVGNKVFSNNYDKIARKTIFDEMNKLVAQDKILKKMGNYTHFQNNDQSKEF